MNRFFAGLIIAGVVMIMGGIDGVLNSAKYPSRPAVVDLAKLEQGEEKLDAWHIQINPVPLTWLAIPASVGVSDKAPSGPGARLIFPVASESHPYVLELSRRHGSSPAPARQGADPRKSRYALFVRSTHFPALEEPPDDLQPRRELTGVIINDLDGVPSKDIDAIRSQFHLSHESRVLVLEHGRRPPSLLRSVVMLTLGPGMFVLAFILLRGRNREN